MKFFLSIAASDSCCGAGIQQDLRVAEQLGYNPLTVVTAVTSQNLSKVYDVFTLPASVLSSQLMAIANAYKISACKIGVITSSEHVEVIADFLQRSKIQHVVLDTVLKSSTGFNFLSTNELKAYKEKLFPPAFDIAFNICCLVAFILAC